MGDKRKNQHEDIEELVKDYQQGNELAGEELLRIFGCHPNEAVGKYIGKYYDLLRYGKMDFGNKDLRKFVSLYIGDKELRMKMIPFYQYEDTMVEVRKVIQFITERFEIVEDEDLLQDLRLLFLQQAKRWEKKGKIGFCGYLYNSYRFAIYHYYKSLFSDLLHQPKLAFDIETIEQEQDQSSDIEIDEAWFFEDKYFDEDEELGFNWIHNKTATFPFNRLSAYERTILFLYYEKACTDKVVSGIVGMHEDTVWGHRKKIKAKLKELLLSGDDNER